MDFRHTPLIIKIFLGIMAIILLITMSIENSDIALYRTIMFYGSSWLCYNGEFHLWRIYSPFTSLFLHGGIFHLLMNGFMLTYLGTIVWQRVGNIGFLIIFFAAGFIGALTHQIWFWGDPASVIGASGSVYGFWGASAWFTLGFHSHMSNNEKRSRMIKFIIFIMAFTIIMGAMGGGISWQSHVGGFFAGLALYPILIRYLRPPQYSISGLKMQNPIGKRGKAKSRYTVIKPGRAAQNSVKDISSYIKTNLPKFKTQITKALTHLDAADNIPNDTDLTRELTLIITALNANEINKIYSFHDAQHLLNALEYATEHDLKGGKENPKKYQSYLTSLRALEQSNQDEYAAGDHLAQQLIYNIWQKNQTTKTPPQLEEESLLTLGALIAETEGWWQNFQNKNLLETP